MADLLHDLENNEAVLLLYLAGELPPGDRDEVERMLATDANLRTMLDELRRYDQSIRGLIARTDAPHRGTAHEEAAVAGTIRAMRRRQTERALRGAAPQSPAASPWPWWTYPVAAAAALLLGYLVWWGQQPFDSPNRPVIARPDIAPQVDQREQQLAIQRLTDLLGENGAEEGALATAEQHLNALADPIGIALPSP